MKNLSLPALLAYGLYGLPLALAALPVYIYVPQFYADRFGLSLTMVGGILLAARVLDAFIDPALGTWMDRGRAGPDGAAPGFRYGRFILAATPLLAAGFVALFHPPQWAAGLPLAWFLGSLLLTYAGFSMATIAHQSWGAALTQRRGERARLTGTREAFALAGVILAAALPAVVGLHWLSALLLSSLALGGALLLFKAPRPATQAYGAPQPAASAWSEPFRNARFRWLLAVFAFNGIAAAVPATLFLFFARDRLQLAWLAGPFLVAYFAAAALSVPLWVALARRMGEARAWLLSMALAVAAFVWAFALPPGAALPFAAICALSGLTLGADLALPPALLAAVIAHAGHDGQREGAYFGAWNWASKMNLALAAGIALPLLEALGYVPGGADPRGIAALGVGYALLPCILKLAAAVVLWRAPLKDL